MSDSKSYASEILDFRNKVQRYLSDRINGTVLVDMIPNSWIVYGSDSVDLVETIHVMVIIDGIKYGWDRHDVYRLIGAGVTPEEVGCMCLSSIRDMVIASTLNKTFKDSDGIWKPQWPY